MSKVITIRHSYANYPLDELTPQGLEFAIGNRERFGGYTNVVCSPLQRSQNTARALGYEKLIVDERIKEFEVDIKSKSAEDYIREVHLRFAQDLYEYGDKLLEAIKYYGGESCLIVSHNAVMSAAFYLLTGEITPFQNLSGFEIETNSNELTGLRRINIE